MENNLEGALQTYAHLPSVVQTRTGPVNVKKAIVAEPCPLFEIGVHVLQRAAARHGVALLVRRSG